MSANILTEKVTMALNIMGYLPWVNERKQFMSLIGYFSNMNLIDGKKTLDALAGFDGTYLEFSNDVMTMSCGGCPSKVRQRLCIIGLSTALIPDVASRDLTVRPYYTIEDFLTAREKWGSRDQKESYTIPRCTVHNVIAAPLNLEKNVIVSGPYPAEFWSDINAVRAYCERTYQQRLADVINILRGVKGKIYAPGDGAGVAYAAARHWNQRGVDISCVSTDKSALMCQIAKEYGNEVQQEDFSASVPEDTIVFLSHVADFYEDTDYLEKIKDRRIISFERRKIFKGCELLKPVCSEWGWALSTRNIKLHGVVGLSKRPYVSDIDYSVFSVVGRAEVRHIDVDLEYPLYVQTADYYNQLLADRTNGVCAVISDKFNDDDRIQAVPGIGELNSITAPNMVGCASQQVTEYLRKKCKGFYSHYPRYCGRIVLVNSDRVFSIDSGIHHVLPVHIVGQFRYVRVPRDVPAICVPECQCRNRQPHQHVLFRVDKRYVVSSNIRNDVIMANLHPTELNLRAACIANYDGNNAEIYFNNLQWSRVSLQFG